MRGIERRVGRLFENGWLMFARSVRAGRVDPVQG
jgi:hypothetical protein